MEKSIVKIMPTKPFRLIPRDIASEIVKGIGSKWDRNGKGLLMGLDDKEREILLPSVINVKPTSTNWEQSVQLFYANLSIKVEPEGKVLDISTSRKTILYDGERIEYEWPNNMKDYIYYKQCLADNTVANNEESLDGTHKYYLINEQERKDNERLIKSGKEALETLYLELVSKDGEGKYKRPDKMKYAVSVFGHNALILSEEQNHDILRDEKEKSQSLITKDLSYKETEFYKVITDKNLATKSIIYACLLSKIIRNIEGVYVDGEDASFILGNSINEVVTFFSNDINSQKVLVYKNKLASKIVTR